ncbi:acetate and sugar kinases/Hsc70/actin family protein [Anabaena azotica]|uniref:Actin-like protein N-terminal domain-containing protein n=1 Tax=Anabaena azotica FACHB-119 TaxID=947527 RepID=A0ABR8DEA2_9NOST|nr:hypothetical protein [Anabaena azotica]MBD2505517.1 hypothetical protein [Anabaena azotica FACHB-119]
MRQCLSYFAIAHKAGKCMNTPNKEITSTVPRIAASFDLGGSHNRGIVQIYPEGVPIVIAMGPEIADASPDSITHSFRQLRPDSTWVGIGKDYYVLGALAKEAFFGTPAIKELKIHYGLPKIAGLFWLASCQLGLGLNQPVEAFTQLLLPGGEIADGVELGKTLKPLLKKGVKTPSGQLKVKLLNFSTSPEGSGIMEYRHRALGSEFDKKSIGLLMLGYRNASFLLSSKGNLAKFETTDLGMSWLVHQFVERTAVGLSKDDLRLALLLVQAQNGNQNALRSISRKSTPTGVESDLKLFNSVLPPLIDDYCRALIRWVKNLAVLDEVLICGGTAEFIRAPLTQYFESVGIPIVWNGGVLLPKGLDTQGLENRIADVWTAHINYIKMLDGHFGYERKQKLVPDNYQAPPNINLNPAKDLFSVNGFKSQTSNRNHNSSN